jgi:hypothetical protein
MAGVLALLAVLFPPRRYEGTHSSHPQPSRTFVFADDFNREYDESSTKEFLDGTSMEFFRNIEVDWQNQATQLGLVLGGSLVAIGILGVREQINSRSEQDARGNRR